MEMQKGILSVSQLNEYVKMLLDGDRLLSSAFIRGELSNCKLYASGHLYFTLKDEEGQLRAVMFRSYASRLAFRPEDGMRVIVHGSVSVYPQQGQYQLYADEMQPDGAGSLALRFEQLRRKLEAEGLFEAARKRPLPPLPRRIGVITSPSGAAVHDIRNVLGRRFPCAEMILFPSAVQGAEAPGQLMMGLEFFSMTGIVDVIILGRGGGSAEDLWAFNDEALARAVAACPIPVVSAVGHESDFTICDFVADHRAPTPSAAAELVVPDRAELLQALAQKGVRMTQRIESCLSLARRTVQSLGDASILQRPLRLTEPFRNRLSDREQRLEHGAEGLMQSCCHALAQAGARLEALSPLAVLGRGYAVVTKDMKSVGRIDALEIGDHVQIRLADGVADATVEKTKGYT